MRTILSLFILFVMLALCACSTGSDSSAEVTAHAMSYSGLQPTAMANGNIVGMRASGYVVPQRKTIFDR